MLYEASHGDTQHIVLIPGNVDECFEFGWKACPMCRSTVEKVDDGSCDHMTCTICRFERMH